MIVKAKGPGGPAKIRSDDPRHALGLVHYLRTIGYEAWVEDMNGNEIEESVLKECNQARCELPAFRHLRIEPLPYSTAHATTACATKGTAQMEITIHQHLIEHCVSKACASKANRDKFLWLGMARSWVRLADEVACAEIAYVASAQGRH
jgi:hypothetical protein